MKQRMAVNDLDEVHWSMEDDGHAVWVNTPCRLIWIERSERVASINDAKHVKNLATVSPLFAALWEKQNNPAVPFSQPARC